MGDDSGRGLIRRAAEAVMPWKKGPFRLCGLEIDGEWRSDWKWDRFAAALPSQKGKLVLDLGCNNGYTMFRLLPQRPEFVLGIDPMARPVNQFELLQRYARAPNLQMERWGWEELPYFEGLFDTILCMGILYHHRNPIGILQHLKNALKPGGLLVMETIVVPGESSTCLFPPDRYARMRNVWFLPTVPALTNMLLRARFTDLQTVAVNQHTAEEQRTTVWSPGPSYTAFLDPRDGSLTEEGHPAPYRAIVFARKRG